MFGDCVRNSLAKDPRLRVEKEASYGERQELRMALQIPGAVSQSSASVSETRASLTIVAAMAQSSGPHVCHPTTPLAATRMMKQTRATLPNVMGTIHTDALRSSGGTPQVSLEYFTVAGERLLARTNMARPLARTR